MPFTATIQALLRAIPGCRAIAFVDLSARLALRSEAQEPLPRDYYDALCLRGARLLGSQAATASTEAFGIDQPPREAVLMRDGGIELFLRAPRDPDEALCALVGPDTGVEAALSQMRRAIAEIVEIAAGTARHDTRRGGGC